MKYPELSIVRFFFKEKLFNHPTANPRVIEFGCGSGHNLRIFEDHGYECWGVDLPSNSDFISDAVEGNWKVNSQFFSLDLNCALPIEIVGQEYDVILFPSVTYYLQPKARLILLETMFRSLKPGGFIFLIERLEDDYRYGKGKPSGSHGFRLSIDETNEQGLTIQFFNREEILETLRTISEYRIANIIALEYAYENLQNNKIVRNSELVVWGRKTTQSLD
jgi:SAM-dependent methyltransferase